ncbi:hypothetical protein DFJ74DRAFT_688414 [Hyaloraphidium curvatum]|nr:hypothetical protein DFJ74DRAFT_688414 [Hyaloraphidium curvatum]
MLFIVDLDGARALAKACVPLVSSIAGFPRADDYTTLGSYIRMCPPGHLRAVLPSLCKDLRLGPKATSEKDIFPALLDEPFSDDLQLSMQLPPEKPLIDLLRDRSRVFLALLEAPSLRDAERRMIAKRYAAACEEQFKDPSFFARLRSLGLYAPTAGSLARFLTRPRFRYGENVQLLGFLKSAMTEPESRRDFFRTVRWALENHPAPPESSHMVLAIHQLAHRDGFEDLLHSLLCLLMFKGADSTDYLLRDAVLGTDTLTGRLLPGFADDVTEVKQWMRWVQNGHIGKLPPELAEMVAIQVWEDAAAACVP